MMRRLREGWEGWDETCVSSTKSRLMAVVFGVPYEGSRKFNDGDVPDDETQPELRVVIDFGLGLDELRADDVSCFSQSAERRYHNSLCVFAEAFDLHADRRGALETGEE